MAITRGFREREGTAEVVTAAKAAFHAQHPTLAFAPLLIVIACLDEADNLPAVLSELPTIIDGTPLDVLVVDDGSTDATTTVAEDHGAYVLRMAENVGHGVALRAGYQLADEGGATFIATLDGDGQWDPADLPAMLKKITDDEADFVIGSRVLGSTDNTDPFRNAGVHVFARMARTLTGADVTDTSSGLRLMKTAVPLSFPQVQPQYQTSELLVGSILHGWRVAEVPTTMRMRMSGESRKGTNLIYGARYARVLLSTWWREARRAERREARPPLAARLLRFALSSVICLGVSLVVLLVLLLAGVTGWQAALIASAVGIVPGYPLNRMWTFGVTGRSTRSEVSAYWITALAGAGLASLFTGGAAHLVYGGPHRPHDGARAVVGAVAYVFAYGLLWLMKFGLLDTWLFKARLTDEPEAVPVCEPVIS